MKAVRLFACLLSLISGTWFGLGQELAAQDPSEAVRQAVEQGNFAAAMQALGNLPVQQRIEWIDELSEIRPRSGSTTSGSHLSGQFRGDGLQPSSDRNSDGQGADGQGGGVVADFRTLINLIETTIDGDWESDGGTNTITPFRSGVWIDPKGMIQPREIQDQEKSTARRGSPKDSASKSSIVLPDLGGWQAKSEFRWVSLRKLSQQLEARQKSGKSPSAAMELVGGLARIEAVSYDRETKDWYLGGPAGGFQIDSQGELVQTESKLPPVLLEDLLSVAPQVLGESGGFGCSIDPVQERLAGVQAFLSNPSSNKLLAKAPTKWVGQVTEKLGPQKVSVFGLPLDSPTGLALVVADQHMKRVGLGLERRPKALSDYIEIANDLDSVPGQGLVRWWFALSDSPISCNSDRTHFELPDDSVCLLSDKEWMDATGKRGNGIGRDIAADRFASEFTKNFGSLQKGYPMYGRLRHIFDLTIAMEIIKRSDHGMEGIDILMDKEIQPRMTSKPEFVPTIATHRILPTRKTVAIVSGGVVVEPRKILSRIQAGETKLPRAENRIVVTASESSEQWMFEAK